MPRSFVVALLLLLHSLCEGYHHAVCRFYPRTSSSTVRLSDGDDAPPPSFLDRNADGTYSDKSSVKEVLSKLMAALAPRAPSGLPDGSSGGDDDDSVSVQGVEAAFSKILAGVRDASDLTAMERSMLTAEASMLLSDIKQPGGMQNIAGSGWASTEKLTIYQPRTAVYTEASAPWVLVHGPGLIGQATLAKLKGLGKAVSLKVIDGESLAVMQDSELNYAVRDAKTVIIAADSKPTAPSYGGSGGLFGGGGGGGGGQDWAPSLSDKALKRLLNAVMNDRNRRGNQDTVKVIAVGKATKPPKSLASFLGGETTEFDSEVILQCKQRQLGYSIVKVGSLLADDAPIPTGLRDRSTKDVFGAGGGTKQLSKEEEVAAQPLWQSPIVFTTSRVEQPEVTRVSVAVDALLRSASHPFNNATVSVLSQQQMQSDGAALLPTDEQWNDEFLKLDGPELIRAPLRFASATQVAVRLGRIVQELRKPGSGLITPIEVERFSNGARIAFRPKESSYFSSKDEKDSARAVDEAAAAAAAGKKQSEGYVTPEQEAKLAKEEAGAKASTASPKKKAAPLEGGLEVIIETTPYRRVRIKRCLMGPTTVVKEESEALILKALTRGIQTLENDYRILIMSGLKTSTNNNA